MQSIRIPVLVPFALYGGYVQVEATMQSIRIPVLAIYNLIVSHSVRCCFATKSRCRTTIVFAESCSL